MIDEMEEYNELVDEAMKTMKLRFKIKRGTMEVGQQLYLKIVIKTTHY